MVMDEFIETTKEDFELFQAECRRWIDIYGLTSWHVYFRHEECEGRYGSCVTSLNGRVATITMATQWPKRDYTRDDICETAFHEATELLMGPINAVANYRYIMEGDVDRECHAVIQILGQVLRPKYVPGQ